MKILLINQSAELYGSDRSLLALASYLLSQKYFHVCVIAPMGDGPLIDKLNVLSQRYPDRFTLERTHVVKINRGSVSIFGAFELLTEFFGALIFTFRKRKQLREFDVVHTNSVSVLLGVIVSTVLRKRHLWNVREILDEPQMLSIVFRTLVGVFSDVVIANSMQTHRWISRSFADSSKYRWIDNGVEDLSLDDQVVQPFTSDYLDKHESAEVICVLGRISSWKGQDVAVRTLFELVSMRNRDFVLLIVGSAHFDSVELETDLHDLICELSLQNRVHVTGFVTDVAAYYKVADYVMVPSTKPEPFGRVAAEAMSCSIPVLASNCGGLMSIIDHQVDGFLVEVNDIDSFADYIELLSDNTLQKSRMGANARSSFLGKFTNEKCFAGYAEEYRKLK
jgi:glycosyltransferase involved in cell wall biosynthesis